MPPESSTSARDYLATLQWLQVRLEAGVEAAEGRHLIHLAPLAKTLTEVARAIDEVKPPEEVSKLDQLTAKRAQRRGAAASG